jgi:O-antigen ligase
MGKKSSPLIMNQDFGKLRMPFLVWMVFISTLVSSVGGTNFLGYNISGYGWVIPLIAALLLLLRNPSKFRFPLRIWLPWVFVVVVYQMFAETEHSFQRSVMLLCPLVVGIAMSKFRLTEHDLEYFLRLCRLMAVALIVLVLTKAGIFLTGILPFTTGLAPEVMTTAILCSLFATKYVFGSKRDLGVWAALAVIPVIAVTRMGMIASAVSLPFTLAPMKLVKRFAFVVLLIVLGISIFYTERVQNKMFYSGEGRLEDVKWANPDFATSGRQFIWENMKAGISEAPWFGNGSNSSEELLLSITPDLTHPHNDWLRLTFDYGYVGSGVFGLTLLLQMLDLYKKARTSSGNRSLLFYTGASSVLIFMLFMLSDNIILYAAFFGNLQFTIIGLAYGSYQPPAENLKTAKPERKLRLKW